MLAYVGPQNFYCEFNAVSLLTLTTITSTASFSGDGDHTLELGPLDYVGSAADFVYSLTCWVPAQSKIRGYYWEEDLGTDEGEGE